jgi:drug/metabolite transporter (DMT)-like permease
VGYLFALLSAALFGANGTTTKLLVLDGLEPQQLALLRSLGTAVIAGGALLITNRPAFRMPRRQLLTMAVLGVTGIALLQAFYGGALGRLPVGIALLLEYTGVLFVALVGFFLFKERVKARLWVAIGLVLAGMVVVAQLWSSSLDPLGVVLALGAAVVLVGIMLAQTARVGKVVDAELAFPPGAGAASRRD